MAMITFSENHESTLVSFEAGQPLASVQQPREQALKWVYSLGAMPTSHVVVVGLGSGFHIEALADFDPFLRITVLESREALIPIFKAQFADLSERVNIVIVENSQDVFKGSTFADILSDRPYVLSFKECWGEQGNLFAEVFAHMTGRSLESATYHFEEFGMNLKAAGIQPGRLLSIKDVVSAVDMNGAREPQRQILGVLGELVR